MKFLITTTLLICLTINGFGQHIRIDKNQLAFLKNEKQISVVFNYDNYKRGGKNLTEDQYIQNRITKLSEKGIDTAIWRKAYEESKAMLWPDAFIRKLNETLERYEAPEFTLDSLSDTNYCMAVYVPWIYSGYDVGIGRSPAKVKLVVTFVNLKTGEKKTSISISDVMGHNDADDNDSEWPHLRRAENAFYNAGYKFGISTKRLFDKK